MESWSRKVGSIDRSREGGIGDPTRSALSPRCQPATKEEEGGTCSDDDNYPLANVEGTRPHPGSLPRKGDRGVSKHRLGGRLRLEGRTPRGAPETPMLE